MAPEPSASRQVPLGTRHMPLPYVRTDGLTKNVVAAVDQVTAVDARARSRGTEVSLGEIIAAGFMPTRERHPIVRTGEREPIPMHVRAAVLFRDNFQCRFCPSGTKLEVWHLDHIVPWSAGGPDTTDNLRVLCERHNVDRSNFIDYTDHPVRPAPWWCHRCYTDEHAWQYLANGAAICFSHSWGPSGPHCRVEKAHLRAIKNGEPATWHRREPLHEFTKVAYCAHCNLPGLTSVTL